MLECMRTARREYEIFGRASIRPMPRVTSSGLSRVRQVLRERCGGGLFIQLFLQFHELLSEMTKLVKAPFAGIPGTPECVSAVADARIDLDIIYLI